MRHAINLLIIVLLLGLLPRPVAADRWVIRSVAVVDVEAGVVRPSQDVYLAGGRIEAIEPATPAPHGVFARSIDGRGKYLLPALADMHVHLEYFDNPAMLWLFLANGVTRVRQMDGRPYLLDWRDRIDEGRMQGPDILTAGPIIDGTPPGRSDIEPVDGEREARARARSQLEKGYDFLKIYHGLDREEFAAVAAVAEARGVRLAGHVPFRVGLESAIAQGLDSVEHLDGYDDLIQPPDSPYLDGYHWQSRFFAIPLDRSRVQSVAEKTAATGFWNCPTLRVKNLLPLHPERIEAGLASAELEYLPKDLTDDWDPRSWTDERGQHYRSLEADDWAALVEGIGNARQLVLALHQAGARLLAGTDTPNPLLVPGFAIHDELAELVTAGLSPAEALFTATVAPFRYWTRDPDADPLQPGQSADLVLLDANPLESIDATRSIAGVVRRGQWLSAATLTARLDQLRQ